MSYGASEQEGGGGGGDEDADAEDCVSKAKPRVRKACVLLDSESENEDSARGACDSNSAGAAHDASLADGSVAGAACSGGGGDGNGNGMGGSDRSRGGVNKRHLMLSDSEHDSDGNQAAGQRLVHAQSRPSVPRGGASPRKEAHTPADHTTYDHTNPSRKRASPQHEGTSGGGGRKHARSLDTRSPRTRGKSTLAAVLAETGVDPETDPQLAAVIKVSALLPRLHVCARALFLSLPSCFSFLLIFSLLLLRGACKPSLVSASRSFCLDNELTRLLQESLRMSQQASAAHGTTDTRMPRGAAVGDSATKRGLQLHMCGPEGRAHASPATDRQAGAEGGEGRGGRGVASEMKENVYAHRPDTKTGVHDKTTNRNGGQASAVAQKAQKQSALRKGKLSLGGRGGGDEKRGDLRLSQPLQLVMPEKREGGRGRETREREGAENEKERKSAAASGETPTAGDDMSDDTCGVGKLDMSPSPTPSPILHRRGAPFCGERKGVGGRRGREEVVEIDVEGKGEEEEDEEGAEGSMQQKTGFPVVLACSSQIQMRVGSGLRAMNARGQMSLVECGSHRLGKAAHFVCA